MLKPFGLVIVSVLASALFLGPITCVIYSKIRRRRRYRPGPRQLRNARRQLVTVAECSSRLGAEKLRLSNDNESTASHAALRGRPTSSLYAQDPTEAASECPICIEPLFPPSPNEADDEGPPFFKPAGSSGKNSVYTNLRRWRLSINRFTRTVAEWCRNDLSAHNGNEAVCCGGDSSWRPSSRDETAASPITPMESVVVDGMTTSPQPSAVQLVGGPPQEAAGGSQGANAQSGDVLEGKHDSNGGHAKTPVTTHYFATKEDKEDDTCVEIVMKNPPESHPQHITRPSDLTPDSTSSARFGAGSSNVEAERVPGPSIQAPDPNPKSTNTNPRTAPRTALFRRQQSDDDEDSATRQRVTTSMPPDSSAGFDINTEILVLRGCQHKFHARCLTSWFIAGGFECPVCRVPYWKRGDQLTRALQQERDSEDPRHDRNESSTLNADPAATSIYPPPAVAAPGSGRVNSAQPSAGLTHTSIGARGEHDGSTRASVAAALRRPVYPPAPRNWMVIIP